MEAQTAFSVGETMLAGEPGYKHSSQGKLANLDGDFKRRPTCKVDEMISMRCVVSNITNWSNNIKNQP